MHFWLESLLSPMSVSTHVTPTSTSTTHLPQGFRVSQETDEETMAIHLCRGIHITINAQLLSLWNAACLAHKCIQRKSTISWELGMSSVVIIIKSSRGSQAEDDGAVLPKIVRFICVFNTRFPTISAKSYCNKIYNIISKIAYIETWSVYTVKM